MAIPTVLAVRYLDTIVHTTGPWWYVADDFPQPNLGLLANPPKREVLSARINHL